MTERLTPEDEERLAALATSSFLDRDALRTLLPVFRALAHSTHKDVGSIARALGETLGEPAAEALCIQAADVGVVARRVLRVAVIVETVEIL